MYYRHVTMEMEVYCKQRAEDFLSGAPKGGRKSIKQGCSHHFNTGRCDPFIMNAAVSIC